MEGKAMERKTTNRHRRQERIRRIVKEQRQIAGTITEAVGGFELSENPDSVQTQQKLQEYEVKHSSDISRSNQMQRDNQEADPERAWKRQPKPWEQGGRNTLSGLSGLRSADGSPSGGIVKSSEHSWGGGHSGRGNALAKGFYIQLFVSGILFVTIFAMFKLDFDMAKKGQQVVASALTESFDFNQAAAWYNSAFAGAPSFIPMFERAGQENAAQANGLIEQAITPPLSEGAIVRSFAETLSGVHLAGKAAEAVKAAETGQVVLVSDEEPTGRTVVVQHVNSRVTVYGLLGSADVAVNDWVEAGQTIGRLKAAADGEASLLFFAVKEKGKYVNPADVVPLD